MNNKKLVRDILLSIPLSLLYLFFINKILELLTSDTVYENKIRKNIAMSFIISIIGIIISLKIFSNGKLKNRIIKYTLIFSGLIILFNTIIYNWPQLSIDTKALFVGIILICGFVYSYKI